MGYARIIGKDIRFAPPLGHQADDELDGEPRPADDRFTGEDLGVERDA